MGVDSDREKIEFLISDSNSGDILEEIGLNYGAVEVDSEIVVFSTPMSFLDEMRENLQVIANRYNRSIKFSMEENLNSIDYHNIGQEDLDKVAALLQKRGFTIKRNSGSNIDIEVTSTPLESLDETKVALQTIADDQHCDLKFSINVEIVPLEENISRRAREIVF